MIVVQRGVMVTIHTIRGSFLQFCKRKGEKKKEEENDALKPSLVIIWIIFWLFGCVSLNIPSYPPMLCHYYTPSFSLYIFPFFLFILFFDTRHRHNTQLPTFLELHLGVKTIPTSRLVRLTYILSIHISEVQFESFHSHVHSQFTVVAITNIKLEIYYVSYHVDLPS